VVKYETENGGPAHSDEEFILTAMAQNAFHHESEGLAGIIQEEMQTLVGLPDRGVEQAGFRVLVGASMPNVLVEMAFISNRKEEKLLNSGETQQKIARAIMYSIKRFKEKYEQGS
jgi:N-acetylmuramoyl-L-alanine amidase